MDRPRALNDSEISVLLERAVRDAAARRDLAGYLHHSELMSALPLGHAARDLSAKSIDEFRAKYRLA